MIIEFSLENFSSVKERVTLSFEASNLNDLEEYYVMTPMENLRLLKLGLIYGANASGKTTILNALESLRDLVTKPNGKKSDYIDFNPFLFDGETVRNDTKFELKFVYNKKIYKYELEFNNDFISKESLYFSEKVGSKLSNVFLRETDVEKQLSNLTFGSKIKLASQYKNTLINNTLWNNTVLSTFLKSNVDFPILLDVTYWFNMVLNPIIYPSTKLEGFITSKLDNGKIDKSILVELLKKADFKIEDIVIKKEEQQVDGVLLDFLINQAINIGNESEVERWKKIKENGKMESREIEFVHKVKESSKSYSLPFNKESTGTQRYFAFSGLLNLLFNNQNIFPIDEIESSLHPDLFKYFLLSFIYNSKDSQVIGTTHFREFLSEKDMLRNDTIWFTEKDDNGGTQLFNLMDFGSNIVRNTTSVYNAYKFGKLGAKPEFQDYYIDLNYGEKK
jgi:AAA15 family ATPase/GTPase